MTGTFPWVVTVLNQYLSKEHNTAQLVRFEAVTSWLGDWYSTNSPRPHYILKYSKDATGLEKSCSQVNTTSFPGPHYVYRVHFIFLNTHTPCISLSFCDLTTMANEVRTKQLILVHRRMNRGGGGSLPTPIIF